MSVFLIKLQRALKNKKGETLMETVISICLFTIIMLAVTMLLSSSMRMTGAAIQDAETLSDANNKAIAGEYAGDAAALTISADSFSVSQPVTVSNENGVLAFKAEVTP